MPRRPVWTAPLCPSVIRSGSSPGGATVPRLSASGEASVEETRRAVGWPPPLSSAEESLGGDEAVPVPRTDPRGSPCARLLRGAAASRYSAARRSAGSSWRAALCGVGCEHLQLGTVRRRQLLNMSLLLLYLLGLLLSSGQGRSGIFYTYICIYFVSELSLLRCLRAPSLSLACSWGRRKNPSGVSPGSRIKADLKVVPFLRPSLS